MTSEKPDLGPAMNDPPPPYPGTTYDAYPGASPSAPGAGPMPVPPMAGPPPPMAGPPPPMAYTSPPIQTAPAPQGPYPGIQPQPGQQTVVIVQHASFPPDPFNTVCPNCTARVTTQTTEEPSGATWLICLLLCAVGLPLCACIPFCVSSCQEVKHKCPQCNKYIGTYNMC